MEVLRSYSVLRESITQDTCRAYGQRSVRSARRLQDARRSIMPGFSNVSAHSSLRFVSGYKVSVGIDLSSSDVKTWMSHTRSLHTLICCSVARFALAEVTCTVNALSASTGSRTSFEVSLRRDTVVVQSECWPDECVSLPPELAFTTTDERLTAASRLPFPLRDGHACWSGISILCPHTVLGPLLAVNCTYGRGCLLSTYRSLC